MNKTWRFFDLATGEVLPHTMVLPDAETVAANTPAGFAAVSLQIDHLSQRVQLVVDDFGASVPVLVDYQPPAPPETEWVTWAWSSERRRWVEAPTLASLQAKAIEPVTEILTSLDAELVRPTTELLAAQLIGAAVDAFAQTKFNTLMARKTALRARMAAINACATQADLDTLASTPMP